MSNRKSRGREKPGLPQPDAHPVTIPREWLLSICSLAEAISGPVQGFSGDADTARVVDCLFQSLHSDVDSRKPIPAQYTAVAEVFDAIEALCRKIVDGPDDGQLCAHLAALGPAGKRLRAAVDAVPVNALVEALEWPKVPVAGASGNGKQLKANEFQLGEFVIGELTRTEKDMLIAFWCNGNTPPLDRFHLKQEVYGQAHPVKQETIDTHRKNLARKVLKQTNGIWRIQTTGRKAGEYQLIKATSSASS